MKQLSIFLENRFGTLTTVLDILKANGVQLIASTIADTEDYGIFRIICDDPSKAYEALRQGGVAVSLCDVVAIDISDTPGAAAEVISTFAAAGVSIAYLYSFLFAGKGVLIFRTDEASMEKTNAIIADKNYKSTVLNQK